MSEINLIALYQQVFGFNMMPRPFSIDTNVYLHEETGHIDHITSGAQYSDLAGSLGTPLFMPCKLDDLWLPNEPMITISGQNTIVKTILTGVKGSVKELINTDDYSIKIQGIIVNETSDDLPEDIIRKIRTICEKRESVTIGNRLLTLFDIHKVAIENFSFPGIEGYQNCQAYEITCYSDWPLNLILKDRVTKWTINNE